MTSDLVLVSGASGFLASHIVKQLQEQGYRVRGTVRSLNDEKKVAPLRKLVENPKYPLELCEADLLDENSWIDAVKDCTYVIHTASPVPNYVPDDENEVYRLFCIVFSCIKILMMILVYKASC
jgi:nucleoside-diphosphate-sugar epimerase